MLGYQTDEQEYALHEPMEPAAGTEQGDVTLAEPREGRGYDPENHGASIAALFDRTDRILQVLENSHSGTAAGAGAAAPALPQQPRADRMPPPTLPRSPAVSPHDTLVRDAQIARQRAEAASKEAADLEAIAYRQLFPTGHASTFPAANPRGTKRAAVDNSAAASSSSTSSSSSSSSSSAFTPSVSTTMPITIQAAAAAAAERDNALVGADAAFRSTNAETAKKGTHPEFGLIHACEADYARQIAEVDSERYYHLQSKITAKTLAVKKRDADIDLALLKSLGRRDYSQKARRQEARCRH